MASRSGPRSSLVLSGVLLACFSAVQPAAATSLDSITNFGASFWDPSNWRQGQSPGAGDTARIHPLWFLGTLPIYLGDVPGFAAQNRQISRLSIEAGNVILDWGSSTGGQAGGLTFSQDDATDPGIGIRVGIDTSTSSFLTMLDAANAPTEAVNIAIGPARPGSGQTYSLSLIATGRTAPPTFHAGVVDLQNFFTHPELLIAQNFQAAEIRANDNTPKIQFGGGSSVVGNVSLLRVRGTSTPLQVAGGQADIAALQFSTEGQGNDATILIGPDPQFTCCAGAATFGTVDMSAFDGSRSAIVVDGHGTSPSSLTIAQLAGKASAGGTLELLVKNGGALTVNSGTLQNQGPSTSGVPSVINLVVDGTGSVFSGAVSAPQGGATMHLSNGAECRSCDLAGGDLRFDSGSLATGGTFQVVGGNAEFVDGATVDGSALLVQTGGVATIADTASARFAGIQLDSFGSPTPAAVTITAANPAIATTSVVAGSVNVSSDFFLLSNGTKQGGDRLGNATLSLLNGSRLRVGDSPARLEQPTIAIGTDGVLTLDATSSAYVGNATATPTYQAGTIILDAGGNLYGNGTINGAGFASGTHPIVLNTGGNLRPGFSPGTLTIDGEYVQQAGVLELEIAGVNPGEYDVLDATQGATFLGGTLRFESVNGFEGVTGAQFDFFAGRSVSFDPSVVIENNTGFSLDFDPATGIATITPEPPLLALFGAGAVGLGWLGRRRA